MNTTIPAPELVPGSPPGSAPGALDQLQIWVQRTRVAANAVEAIIAMVEQLQTTAANFGAGVAIDAAGSGEAPGIEVTISLGGIIDRPGPPPIRTDDGAAVLRFRHRPAAPGPDAPVTVRPDSPAPDLPPAPAAPPSNQPAAPPATGSDDPLRNMGQPWSDEDCMALLTQPDSGLTMREFAESMGRTVGACRQQLKVLRRAERSESVPLDPVPDAQASADARVALRLDLLPVSVTWSPARDLQLVEAVVAGRTPDETAREMALSAGNVRARLKLLCPTGAPEEQAQVLRVLQQRATGAIIKEKTG